MKNILPLLIAVLMLVACDSKSKQAQKQKSPDTSQVKEDSHNQNALGTEETDATSGWGSTSEKVFINTCVENAKAGIGEQKAKDYCNCMLRKMEAKYKTPEEGINITMAETMEMAKGCLK
jgi:hypothetical protein